MLQNHLVFCLLFMLGLSVHISVDAQEAGEGRAKIGEVASLDRPDKTEESDSVLSFQRDQIIVRYRDEFSSPAFTLSELNSTLLHQQHAQAYCGRWDFRFWLVLEQEWVQKELQVSESKLERIKKASSRVVDIRKKLKTAVDTPESPEGIDVTELADAVYEEVKALLDDAQIKRLAQLEMQYLLARYGGEFVRSIPVLADAEGVVSDEELNILDVSKKQLERIGRRVDSITMVKASAEVLGQWLEPVVDGEVAKTIFAESKEYGLDFYPQLQIHALANLDEIVKEQQKVKATSELWGISRVTTISPTGSFDVEQKLDRESSIRNLLANIALNPAFVSYLELTQDQKDQAIQLLKAAKKDGRRNLDDDLDQVLLPHQREFLNQRAVWREVEVFGFAPSLAAGRLGVHAKLTEQQKKSLLDSVSKLATKLKAKQKENQEERLALVISEMEQIGLGDVAQKLFGTSSKQLVFNN